MKTIAHLSRAWALKGFEKSKAAVFAGFEFEVLQSRIDAIAAQSIVAPSLIGQVRKIMKAD
jgi:hypothetical protein